MPPYGLGKAGKNFFPQRGRTMLPDPAWPHLPVKVLFLLGERYGIEAHG